MLYLQKFQKQPPDEFWKKRCSWKFAKFTENHPFQSLFFGKVPVQACNFIKKETLTQVFCKVSKSTFFTEHLRRLLLEFFRFTQRINWVRETLPNRNSALSSFQKINRNIAIVGKIKIKSNLYTYGVAFHLRLLFKSNSFFCKVLFFAGIYQHCRKCGSDRNSFEFGRQHVNWIIMIYCVWKLICDLPSVEIFTQLSSIHPALSMMARK